MIKISAFGSLVKEAGSHASDKKRTPEVKQYHPAFSSREKMRLQVVFVANLIGCTGWISYTQTN